MHRINLMSYLHVTHDEIDNLALLRYFAHREIFFQPLIRRNSMSFQNIGKPVYVVLSFVAGSAAIGILFLMLCLKFVDSYEIGYNFNKWRGEKIEQVSHQGYVMAIPFVNEVHTIDLRPMQVCIAANGRVLNCKLVKFNPQGLELFLSWHGRSDYMGPGNTTVGVQGCTTQFCEILKVYAFEEHGIKYPFLEILKDTAEASR